MILALILGFILGAGAIIFIFENTAIVALTFFGLHFQLSIAVLVIAAILLGVVLSFLAILPSSIGNAWRMRKLKKHNDTLQGEVELHKQEAVAAHAKLEAVSAMHAEPGVIDLRS